MKFCRWSSTLLLTCFVSATYVLGQDTASITGTVTDPTGANIMGAQITIENVNRGISRFAVTNADGEYLLAGVQAGSYDLTVAAAGFKKFKVEGIILRVAQKARVDASL